MENSRIIVDLGSGDNAPTAPLGAISEEGDEAAEPEEGSSEEGSDEESSEDDSADSQSPTLTVAGFAAGIIRHGLASIISSPPIWPTLCGECICTKHVVRPAAA